MSIYNGVMHITDANIHQPPGGYATAGINYFQNISKGWAGVRWR